MFWLVNNNPDPSENPPPPPLQPSSMSGYFTGTGKLVPANRPCENPSMWVISNTEGYFRGQFAGTICGDVLLVHVLLYILVPLPVKYLPMELRELHTRGRGWGRVSPVPVKFPAHGTGGLDVMQGHMILMAQLQPPLHVTCTAGEQ